MPRLAGVDADVEYEYVVGGAGSAGCILANRLSADPKNRVLVLEAGGRDNWVWFHIPAGYLFAIGNPRADWCFRTEAEPGLNGRSLAYPRGKVIGGSSAINAMIYMHGQAGDYDHWRQLGLTGWGWDDVLPYFKKHEDHFLGASDAHAVGGELRIEPPRVKWEILEAYREAAAERGIAAIDDFNCGDNAGSCYFHVNQRRGLRWSSATAFLKPVLSRPNLHLLTECHVEKLAFEGTRASAVTVRHKGATHTVRCRGEVTLSSGSIGSVEILQRSGIGPADVLRQAGVEVLREMPGVGANLQDHLQLRIIYKLSNARTMNETYHSLVRRGWMGVEYALFRRWPLTMAPSQLGVFVRSEPERERANLQFHIQPLSLDKFGDPLHRFPGLTTSVCNLQPESRGMVRIRSADLHDKPFIAPNYLSTEEDRRVAAQSIRIARQIARAPALERYRPEEFLPGPGVPDEDEALAKAAGDIGTTIFHPVGTAKMGLASDRGAVVDERLRVIGLGGLRVVDASVMPTITSGNTNSPTMMIAEKGASMILEDARQA